MSIEVSTLDLVGAVISVNLRTISQMSLKFISIRLSFSVDGGVAEGLNIVASQTIILFPNLKHLPRFLYEKSSLSLWRAARSLIGFILSKYHRYVDSRRIPL